MESQLATQNTIPDFLAPNAPANRLDINSRRRRRRNSTGHSAMRTPLMTILAETIFRDIFKLSNACERCFCAFRCVGKTQRPRVTPNAEIRNLSQPRNIRLQDPSRVRRLCAHEVWRLFGLFRRSFCPCEKQIILDVSRLLGPLLEFSSEPAIARTRRGAIEEMCGFNP